MPDVEQVKTNPQRIKVAVTLQATTTVTVTLMTSSDKTVDEMKQAALQQFERAGGTEYRNQFRSNLAISLGSVETKVGELHTVPMDPFRNEY